MTAFFPAAIILCLTLSLALSGCSTRTTDNSPSNDINLAATLSTTQQPDSANNSGKQKKELTKIYTQAIGDYIRLANEEYNLIFDTLFFGKHVNGQPTDFPDIALPTAIENTRIKIISPEQGEENQKKNRSSFYINLFGSTNPDNADFIFVTFSDGFTHQFDCFIKYKYDTDEKKYVIETSRFKNYRYKKNNP
jgi:uncharacterized protein YceK